MQILEQNNQQSNSDLVYQVLNWTQFAGWLKKKQTIIQKRFRFFIFFSIGIGLKIVEFDLNRGEDKTKEHGPNKKSAF